MKPVYILAILYSLMIACSLPVAVRPSQPAIPASTEAPAYFATMAAQGTIPPTPNVGDYPGTPEAVVSAYMIDFQKDPENLNVYLSQQRLGQLPPEGAVALLQLKDTLEGFVVRSGTLRLNKGIAKVEVGIMVAQKETKRVFILVLENGRWVIDGIEIFD